MGHGADTVQPAVNNLSDNMEGKRRVAVCVDGLERAVASVCDPGDNDRAGTVPVAS